MSNNRQKILLDLLNFSSSLNKLKMDLTSFKWDIEEELVTLTKDILVNILNRFLNSDLSSIDVEEWANLIESREDISFYPLFLKEIIFELANPYLEGELNIEKAEKYLSDLNSQI